MTVQIVENCVTCGACVWECPNEAVSPGDPRPVVEENLCTECYGFFGEAQCIVVCPVDAIVLKPEPVEDLLNRFRQLHPDKTAQDTWIWRRIGETALRSSAFGVSGSFAEVRVKSLKSV